MKRTMQALAFLAALAALPAAAQDKIKIGYAISKTGPNAGGASITQIPNYEMWVKDVNAKGGLMLGGKFSILDYFIWNEIPTVLGNLVGGLAFTGLTLYATHVKTAPKRSFS